MMLRRYMLKFRTTFPSVINQTYKPFIIQSPKRAKTSYSIQTDDNIIKSTIFENIPENRSIYDHVTSRFSFNKDKIALIDGITGEKYTYGYLDVISRKFGSFLMKDRFTKNDTLALYAPNCVQYGAVLIGTLGIGGCVSTINPQYTEMELMNQLIDSNSKVIVTTSELLETVKSAAKETNIKHIITLEDDGERQHDYIYNWSDIMNDDGKTFEKHPNMINSIETCALLPYSSGTTGKPKGVVLTHHNILSNMVQLGNLYDKMPRDVLLGLLPFFHIYGLALILLQGLLYGKSVVTLPKFEPHTFLQAIQDFKIDFLYLVPPLILFLVKSPDVANYDISSIRHVTTGAAPFGVDLWKNFQEKFSSDVKIMQGYGLTEVSPVATLTPADEEHIKIGTVGKIIPNSEIKIVSSVTGENVGVNSIGEIAIKGPHVMKGYLNNPKATNDCITKDGWFFSGDLGYFDEEHNFFIVDRAKELIKYKGMQVAPAELEDFLITHSKIRDAAVIGIPEEKAGEVPKAFVVADGEITEEEILKYVESSLAPFKRLRGGVEFIDSIPRAASGKILRRMLREKKQN